MLGGGYSDDDDWFEREFAAAGNQAVRLRFITWALRKNPKILDAVIARKPKAIFLSFDDPEPFAGKIKAAGIPCHLPAADARRCRARHRLRRRRDRRAGDGGRRPRRHARDPDPGTGDRRPDRQARAADPAVRRRRHSRRPRSCCRADAGRRRRRGGHTLLGVAGGAGAAKPAPGGTRRIGRRHGAPERARHRARAPLAGSLHGARAAQRLRRPNGWAAKASCATTSGTDRTLSARARVQGRRPARSPPPSSAKASALIHAIEPAARHRGAHGRPEAETLLRGERRAVRGINVPHATPEGGIIALSIRTVIPALVTGIHRASGSQLADGRIPGTRPRDDGKTGPDPCTSR